jgi:cytochrome P450
LGAALGMTQMKLVVAMIVQRYRLELMPGHPIENEYGVVLRPRYGMRMVVRKACS